MKTALLMKDAGDGTLVVAKGRYFIEVRHREAKSKKSTKG
jgi:hypothetical protein